MRRRKNEEIVDGLIQFAHNQKNKRIIQFPGVRRNYAEQQEAFRREEAKADHDYLIYRSAEIEYDRDPITEVPDDVKLPTVYFEEAYHKTEYNKTYAEYYEQRFIDTNLEKFRSMSERILNCHKSWFGDVYKNAGIFNVKKVYHCHNRWCWLCSHLKQAQRLYKYHIRFETLLKDYDLYHVVFTVPNVKGNNLKSTLTKMQASFKYIIRYFQGFKKIAGIDFTQYGLAGAVRSFEIVINPRDYHPHIHCLFLMKKDLGLVQTEINKYSFDGPILKRKFSALEIMLQKIFYLLMNGQKVTLKNIQSLKLGYSCIMDQVEGDQWQQVFKYATKMSKDGASSCTYKQFVLLDDIFRRMKMIQGYGIFYDVDDDEDEKDPTAEILFQKVLIMLDRNENPERDIHIKLEKFLDELHKKNLTVISKKMSYKYLKSIMEDLRKDLMIEDGFAPF